MVGEEELERGFAGFLDLLGFGADDHAFGDGKGAGGLKFGHFLDFNEAHAAGGLEGVAFVVAEGGDFDSVAFGGIDDEGAGCGLHTASVDGQSY